MASETEPPNTDYVDYNQFKSALVAIPRDFKVRLIPRDGVDGMAGVFGGKGEKGGKREGIEGGLEECLEEARERTEGYYREDLGVEV